MVPKGKAAAVGTEPLGSAQAEVGNEPWHRECQPCPVGAGQEQRGQIPAQGEGGGGFLKAAPAVTTESALPTTVIGSILHYLPTCKSSEVGGFKLIFALLWPSDVTLCVCCQSCAGNAEGQQGGSRGWNCGPESLSTVPRSPLPACSSLRSSSKPRYGHSSWGCSSPELLSPLEAGGGTKFCCCIYWCCAGSGHPLSPPWVLRALLWVAEGEEKLPEGHQQQSPALGCHGRRVCVQDVTRCPMRCTRLCQRAHKHHESTQSTLLSPRPGRGHSRSLKSHHSAREPWEA